jgi:hypothetical protein
MKEKKRLKIRAREYKAQLNESERKMENLLTRLGSMESEYLDINSKLSEERKENERKQAQ